MRQEYVCKENEHAADDHGVGGCLTDIERTSLYVVAIERGYAGDDERKEYAFDDTHPDEPRLKGVEQTHSQIFGGDDAAKSRGIGPNET